MFSAEGALRKVDLQSAFFALVFVIVLLVLGTSLFTFFVRLESISYHTPSIAHIISTLPPN